MDAVAENFAIVKAAPHFPIWESKLVGRLGIGRSQLLRLRLAHLVEGVHWIKKARRVWLNSEGLALLEEQIGLLPKKPRLAPLDAFPEPVPEPLPTPVYIFKVWGKKVAHPHMILATDGVNVFRVLVKTKTNFLPGMEIRCEHDRLDLFNHVGNCPRFRGKY